MNEKIIDALARQSGIVAPGEVMFLLLHTGEAGVVPPSDGVPGEVDGHCFGPFVTEEEATEWQRIVDETRGACSCRRAIVEVIVPRLLAVIGPAGVPPTPAKDKDRMN